MLASVSGILNPKVFTVPCPTRDKGSGEQRDRTQWVTSPLLKCRNSKISSPVSPESLGLDAGCCSGWSLQISYQFLFVGSPGTVAHTHTQSNPCCYKMRIKQMVSLFQIFKFREFAPTAYLGVMTHLQYISCLSLLSGITSTSCLPLPRISPLTTKTHQKLWWQAKYTACVWGLPTSSFLFSPANVIWAFGPLSLFREPLPTILM